MLVQGFGLAVLVFGHYGGSIFAQGYIHVLISARSATQCLRTSLADIAEARECVAFDWLCNVVQPMCWQGKIPMRIGDLATQSHEWKFGLPLLSWV